MEGRLQANFEGVRIHNDAQAARAATEMRAHAFAVGNHVVFGEKEFRPDTANGSRLLAHELAHVVQQSHVAPSRSAHNGDLERDALRAADAGGSPALASTTRPAFAKVKKETACIRPVSIADDDGKHPTTIPSFAAAKRVWGQCCIDLNVKQAAVVKATKYQTLDESKNNTPTAEESALFADAGGSGGCISVFVANTFHQDHKTSKDISGGGGTYDGGGAEPKVVVVEGVDPTIVAHELGHAMGRGPHGPAGTIMDVTANRHDQAEKEVVNKDICDSCYAFAGAKTPAAAKEDCDFPP